MASNSYVPSSTLSSSSSSSSSSFSRPSLLSRFLSFSERSSFPTLSSRPTSFRTAEVRSSSSSSSSSVSSSFSDFERFVSSGRDSTTISSGSSCTGTVSTSDLSTGGCCADADNDTLIARHNRSHPATLRVKFSIGNSILFSSCRQIRDTGIIH